MRNKISVILLLVGMMFLFSSTANAAKVGGPHLWMAASDGAYVMDSPDPWQQDSWIVGASTFDLYIYNASHHYDAEDISLMVAVHQGETGSIMVNGTEITTLTPWRTDITASPPSPQYNAGSHGVYEPSGDATFYIFNLGGFIEARSPGGMLDYMTVGIEWSGFSQVHFDVYSANGFYNPPSHDVTAVPEPATMLLLGTGLVGLVGLKRRKSMK